MDWKKLLMRGREHYQRLELQEAYNLFRRFYDRLPFDPQPEHAEYIGIFVRTLGELGKSREMEFYLRELERLASEGASPELMYQLGVVYVCCLTIPRPERAKQIFEDILRNPKAHSLHAKAKMMLADYYDRFHNNTGMCRTIIHSIPLPQNPDIDPLVLIWKAKILVDDGKREDAIAALHEILLQIEPQLQWYPYFCTKLILANALLLEDRFQESHLHIQEVRNLFRGKRLKTLEIQLTKMENTLRRKQNALFQPGDSSKHHRRAS